MKIAKHNNRSRAAQKAPKLHKNHPLELDFDGLLCKAGRLGAGRLF